MFSGVICHTFWGHMYTQIFRGFGVSELGHNDVRSAWTHANSHIYMKKPPILVRCPRNQLAISTCAWTQSKGATGNDTMTKKSVDVVSHIKWTKPIWQPSGLTSDQVYKLSRIIKGHRRAIQDVSSCFHEISSVHLQVDCSPPGYWPWWLIQQASNATLSTCIRRFFLRRDGACSPASSHASQFMDGWSMHDMLHWNLESPGASHLVPVLGFPLQPHRCPMSLIFLNLDYPVECEVKTRKICVLKVSWGILS